MFTAALAASTLGELRVKVVGESECHGQPGQRKLRRTGGVGRHPAYQELLHDGTPPTTRLPKQPG
ncbi:hypothetical protein [Streptomyces sp. TP-A0874]|uniref:hypothetical protein n=1 Tax=Streptomyces sp. TP-A0874 TaxID=549819 RepID=UPI001FCD2B24|nr:hypothetical protein [Streptomyces sp. TP-A0874]